MVIEINLTQLSNKEIAELDNLLASSIDYSKETEEMQMNYEASQIVTGYRSENEID